ncbi:CGNR zinc finger domain-containing protein [Phytomonospora sp. NPDC050363]|uniref:CGNR zinc finger domain-containing protein n=1 Tax=Phytomonospora sp. NPDC050363 TaxID=3155642 RepID=UPI0033FFBA6F
MTVTARLLTNQWGESFRFDPGNFCLELLLTGGPPPYDVYEILTDPAHVAVWITESRLTVGNPLDPADVLLDEAGLDLIRDFRNVMWRVAPAVASSDRPAGADLEFINEAVGDPPHTRLDPGSGVLRWAPPVTAAQVVAAAARDAVEMIGTDARERVRQCQGNNCKLLFLDTSRPGNRRWCSMQRCGNRHKVSTYRHRRQPPG